MSEPQRYLDVPGCAAYLGRTVEAIYTMTKRGKIPHIKVGRKVQFDRDRLDRWMERHTCRVSG